MRRLRVQRATRRPVDTYQCTHVHHVQPTNPIIMPTIVTLGFITLNSGIVRHQNLKRSEPRSCSSALIRAEPQAGLTTTLPNFLSTIRSACYLIALACRGKLMGLLLKLLKINTI
eukprot:g25241.t1